jgi:hypothetical protein
MKTTLILFLKEDDLNNFFKGRGPQFFYKWKTTQNKIMQPKTSKSKNNNIFENGRQPNLFLKNSFFKGRRPQ